MDRDPAPAELFRRADAVFDAALEVPAVERAAFVDRECADDAALRAAVHRLLCAHGQADRFLESPAAVLAAPLLDPLAASTEGDARFVPARVGPFRVVREIGRGGMGAVYLAQRDDGQFQQRVALKLVRAGIGADHLVRRFLEERRILAALEHPRIARLLDGGLTPDGLPYFAMEYVEGEPVTEYCDKRRLGVEQRLRLFVDVCDAVQYAHRNLVVHRDLKPSNILVAADGQVKLLDFGVAKLLGEQAEDGLTGTAVRMLTPDYASPEQFRGEAVTTATDVYALGLLLYELIAGRHPFRAPGLPRHEIEQRVLSRAPESPSSIVRRRQTGAHRDPAPGTETAELASRRGITSQRLRRRLRGDLDTIVLKAIRKEPERRYATVQQLAADVRRHLAGLPVEARPDSAWYRARKLAGRHRAGVAFGALVLVLAQAVTVRELQMRRRAEAAAVEAQASARRADAVRDFLIGIFEVSDPFGTSGERGDDVSARTLLDRGVERVDDKMAGEPDVQAELRGVLGRVYTNLGLFDQAGPLLERSLEQRRAAYGVQHASVAEAMNALGSLFLDQSRHDEAEPLLREALESRRRLLGDQHETTAQSLDRLATLLQERSEYDAAEPLFQEALAIRRTLFGDDHPEVASSLNNLALLLWWKADYAQAELLYRQSLDIRQPLLGEDHPITSATKHNIAQVLYMLGRLEESESLYREALAAKRRVFGAHPTVTINLNNLGRVLRDKGELEEAESLVREALALDRQIFGDEHAFVAASLDHLGGVLRAKGEFDEAEAAFRQAIAISRRVLGDEHARVAQYLNSLGTSMYTRGNLDPAEATIRDALAIYRKLFGDDHPFTARATVNLAKVLSDQGRADAEPLFLDAIDRLATQQPAASEHFIGAHVGLGRLLIAQGKAAEALPLLEDANRRSRDQFGEHDWRTAEAELALGNALAAHRRYDEAEPLLLQARTTLRAARSQQPRLAGDAEAATARLYAVWQRPR